MLPIPFVHSCKAARRHGFRNRAHEAGRTSRPHRSSREAISRERRQHGAQHHILGLAWALSPKRIRGLPNVVRLCFDELLAPDYALPDPERAFDSPLGLAGIVHDLSPPTLLTAYRRGLYPFAHIAPLKWWSPPLRSVLFFNGLHIAKRLRRQMRQDNYTVTLDRDFEAVIAACAGQRDGSWRLTWITPRIMRAYADLFDAGYAHSFEVWNERGELADGSYGIALGRAFVTESQFSREPNTSKMGFTALNWQLARWSFDFNDGKLMTPTCHAMGFRGDPTRRISSSSHTGGTASGKAGPMAN